MANYSQILPFRDDVRVDEQFGFKPFSIIKPTKSHKKKWKDAYLDDGQNEQRRSDDIEYLAGLGFSEFHSQLAENILKYWSLSGSVVCDPFSGRATRAVISEKLNRKYIGYEVSPTTVERVKTHFNKVGVNPTIHLSDGTLLSETQDGSVDLIFTCPPYYNIEKYESVEGQLSDEDTYETFIDKMEVAAKNSYRVLKDGAFSVWVVGDFREGGKLRNFHGDMINKMTEVGFDYHDLIVVENISPFAGLQLGKVASKRYTSKIHEYILVFKKPGEYIIPDYCEMDELYRDTKSKQFFDF